MISPGNRRYCNPIVIGPDNTIKQLNRIPFNQKKFDEGWLQALISNNPYILPVSEIEPFFAPLVSIGREIPVDSGAIDNLFISPEGYLTIVETKLWRNPEARREVVGQIIDYAKDLNKWDYEQLNKQVGIYHQKTYGKAMGILEKLREVHPIEDEDEPVIIDNISRNLKQGRFLLLIVGDGIRESVEAMTAYLVQTPQLNFSLALVELQVFELTANSEKLLLVVPHVVARTKEIIRAVVHVQGIETSNVKVDLDLGLDDAHDGSHKTTKKRILLTEQDFLGILSNNVEAQDIELLLKLIDKLKSFGCFIQPRSSSITIRLHDPSGSGQKISLLTVTTSGNIYISGYLPATLKELGLPNDIWTEYCTNLFNLFNIPDIDTAITLRDIGAKFEDFIAIVGKVVSDIKYSSGY